MSHLYTFIFNVPFQGPVTIIRVSVLEYLAVEMYFSFFSKLQVQLCRSWDLNTQPSFMQGECSNQLHYLSSLREFKFAQVNIFSLKRDYDLYFLLLTNVLMYIIFLIAISQISNMIYVVISMSPESLGLLLLQVGVRRCGSHIVRRPLAILLQNYWANLCQIQYEASVE